MDIKEYLKSYRVALKCAEQYFRDLDALTFVQSPKIDGMPRNGIPHGLELQVEQRERLRNRAEKERKRAFEICDDIERRIYALDNATFRVILQRRYIDGYEWAEVARAVGYSTEHVFRLHRAALSELRKEWEE